MTRHELSYAAGPTEPPLLEMSLGQALRQTAERWPDALALVSRHQQLRFKWVDLKVASDRFALGLDALGLGKGDRVGIWAQNCAEWTIAQFATASLDIILVNINPAYRVAELESTLTKVGVKAMAKTASAAIGCLDSGMSSRSVERSAVGGSISMTWPNRSTTARSMCLLGSRQG